MRDRIRWFVSPLGLGAGRSTVCMGDQRNRAAPAVEGTVNFELYRGYLMIVRGSAGPVKGLNFLLDTGASSTVLDPQLARKLHLRRLACQHVAVLGGQRPRRDGPSRQA